jgi:hypothetical protein
MDHDLICSWFGLPRGDWPPDHYRLLGLDPGEGDAELIEQRVHQRLDEVRRYQMMHPEPATEAMNRLAQAFVCLMEPATKRAYDTEVLGLTPPPAPVSPQARTADTGVHRQLPGEAADTGVYQPVPTVVAAPPPPLPAAAATAAVAPPPPRLPPPLPPLPAATAPPPAPAPEAPPTAPAANTPPPEPVDPLVEAARSSPARRGIGTKRALYFRVARTRQLLRVWTALGKYLSSPKRRLNRAVEGPDLVRLLEEVGSLLRGFPPLLGEAGQPGYLVLALTQVDTVKAFQSFSPHQREALTRDWRAGIKLLLAHRDFLRQEIRAMRKRTFRQRLARGLYSLVTDQPGTVLLLLALLALNVALWRTYAVALWEKLFAH